MDRHRRHPPLMRMKPSVLTLLLSLNHQHTRHLPKMQSYYGASPHMNERVDLVLLTTRYAVSHVQDKISIWALRNTISQKGYTCDDKLRGEARVCGQLERTGCDPLASLHWIAHFGRSAQVKRRSNSKPLQSKGQSVRFCGDLHIFP